MPPDESSHGPELVKGGDNEIDADVIIATASDFRDEFLFRGIVKDHGGNLDVFCDVIEAPAPDHLAVAEDTLASGHLGMKQFGGNRIPFAIPPKGTVNGGEQQIRHAKTLPAKSKPRANRNTTSKEA